MDYESQEYFRIGVLILLLVVSLGVHEAAHAWAAWRCGDDTAKRLGRMTLNPLPHIDLFNTILLPALTYFTAGIVFGGAKPVPVDFSRLRNPLPNMAFVAVAGPASNVLLAVLAYVCVLLGVHVFPAEQALRLWDLMQDVAFMNLLLAVFNMLPVPPLDGSRVLAWLLPKELRPGYVALERWGMLIILGLFLFVPPVGNFVRRTAIELHQSIAALVLD